MARSLWVLIAAAGKPDLLARTLRWIAAAEKPAIYRGTLVVENGPRCGVESAVTAFPRELRFRYLYVPEANKSHALNCGLTRLEDGLVVMTDDDVRFDSQVLMAYAAAAKNRDGGEFYGGPVLIDAEHGLPPAWLRRYYPLTIAEPWKLPHAVRTVVRENVMGTNWAAYASDLRAIGSFDTRLGPGAATGAAGQETEAQRRLVAKGGRAVYLPEAIAWHYLHLEFLDRQWLLRRTYRHALEWGVRRARGQEPMIWPTLRAALGQLNARVKGAVLRLIGGEKRCFAADFHEAKWRGRCDGLALGRRWNELPQLVPPLSAQHDKQAA